MYTLKANTQNEAKKKRSLFSKLFVLINFVFILLLLLSYLSPFISPEFIWYFAFLGLAYPVLLLVNVIFCALWLFLKSRLYILSLFAIIIGWFQLSTLFQINMKNDVSLDTKDNIKIVSYNVRLFDYYKWIGDSNTRYRILNLLKTESPNIICLQEILVDTAAKFNSLKTLTLTSPSKNIHAVYRKTLQGSYKLGIATLTSYPIIHQGAVPFKEKSRNMCIYTDILIANDTVRIYNLHLQSIRFQREDYKFMKDLSQPAETDEFEKSKGILKRLKQAFIIRSKQVKTIEEHISSCPYSVIVCGDFNDTPSSYTYHTLSSKMQDAFVERGNWIGNTYVGIFPSFRIDYILFKDRFTCNEYKKINSRLSDHYPISAKLGLSKDSH